MKVYLREYGAVVLSFVVLLFLWFLPTGFEENVIFREAERTTARVLSVDNEDIVEIGLMKTGEQRCQLEVLSGLFQGQQVTGANLLSGALETDKIFQAGDKAYVLITHSEGAIRSVSMIDHYRLDTQLVLVILFGVFLMLVAGKQGVRAILSFAITVLMLWKVLVPCYLKGYNPIIVGFLVTAVLIILIISLVYGFDYQSLSAICGSMAGLWVTAMLGVLFTDQFQIHGAIMSGSESLLYSGYAHLNLTQIFMASIFIGSSGAVMDLAVDITSSVHEVVEKKPDITTLDAIKSGITVGRAAMGTMTTTLLLAYSGGYITTLMIFMAQGTPLGNILNYKGVSSQILDTLVGSFGLVSVAPLTACCAGYFLTKHLPEASEKMKKEENHPPENEN